jgi:ribosomal protein L13
VTTIFFPIFFPTHVWQTIKILTLLKVHFSGNKWKDKLYRWHTGYPGGLKERAAKDMLERKPEEVLKKAILGMLKRNNLRHQSIEPRLRIYTGPEHPHAAQLPLGTTAPIPSPPRAKSGDFHFGLETYNSQKTVGSK